MGRCQFLLPIVIAGCALAVPATIAQGQEEANTGMTGAQVYARWCSDCHSTPMSPGSMALQRRYQGTVPAILDQRSNLSPAFVSVVVRRGMGFMPSFRKTEISDAELARVADYLVAAGRAAGQ